MKITDEELRVLIASEMVGKNEPVKEHLQESQRRRLADRYEAKAILLRIPELVREAVEIKQTEARLMTIKLEDFNRPDGANTNFCEPEWLRGVCKIVYRKCKELGLSPTIRYEPNSIVSTFYIILHW